MWIRKFIVASVWVTLAPASLAQAVNDSTEQRLAPCTACHGKQGQGLRLKDYLPRIGGKPAGYLYNQLQNFKTGRRQYPEMNYLVAYLSDDYLNEMASYFASQRPPPDAITPTALSADESARMQSLVMKGDASRNVPACSSCHGNQLTGRNPDIPGLIGLYPDYVRAQLGAWRSGTRHTNAPDCMAVIAQRLSVEEIGLLSSWLANQTVPANAIATPPTSEPLTLACFSETPAK